MIIFIFALLGFILFFGYFRDIDAAIGGAYGALLIGTVFFCFFGYFIKYTPELESEIHLVAIRDQLHMSGTFFLGSGAINEETYYFYYQQLPDGSFQPDKIKANSKVFIFEEKRKDGILQKYRYVPEKRWLDWFFCGSLKKRYEIHVPIGTIRQGYSI